MSTLHRVTALLFILLYLALAFRMEDALYPAFRFDMFSQPWQRSYGTPLVRLPTGEVVHPVTLRRWSCPPDSLVPQAPSRLAAPSPDDPCSGFHLNSGTERLVRHWILTHPEGEGPPLQPIELFRRVYRFPDQGGPPETVDCPVATCRAGGRAP